MAYGHRNYRGEPCGSTSRLENARKGDDTSCSSNIRTVMKRPDTLDNSKKESGVIVENKKRAKLTASPL